MRTRRPSPLALALTHLRTSAGLSMGEMASILGLSKSLISAYERGAKPLTREQLESLVAPLGYQPEAVDGFLLVYGLIHPEPVTEAASPLTLSPEDGRLADRAAMAAAWTAGRIAGDAVKDERIRLSQEREKAAALQRAEELFQGLSSLNRRERRGIVEAFAETWNWALAVRLCQASVKSATHRVEEAQEFAELAVYVAERVPGEKSWRSRLLGYCWAHVGNARRVANDLTRADDAFTKAWVLWQEGAGSDSSLLEEWLLPAMEASLRRAQRRFSDALELLRKARTSQGGAGANALLTILLNEVNIFSRMGEPQRALEALAEATPLFEASGERQMLLALRFNMADSLCQLRRFEEAAELLPQIREFALQRASDLDLIRIAWLSARVAAGQGQIPEAIAGLAQVSQDFTARELPYNAALSSLDLAELLLRDGRTAEVRKLAAAMRWIFKANGIDREALAALKLFCDAARQEAATLHLTRRVITAIEEARRSAPSYGGSRA